MAPGTGRVPDVGRGSGHHITAAMGGRRVRGGDRLTRFCASLSGAQPRGRSARHLRTARASGARHARIIVHSEAERSTGQGGRGDREQVRCAGDRSRVAHAHHPAAAGGASAWARHTHIPAMAAPARLLDE